MALEVTPDPAVQELIMKGEQLVRSGQEASTQGKTAKAYEKFYAGLQYLMQVMPRLGDGTPAIAAMKARIHSYMDEFEMLKKQKDEPKDGSEGEPVETRITRGEELMLSAQRLAKRNSLTEAYDKCCAGLKILVEVMPTLKEDDAHGSRLRAKISGYLEMAERIKERRDSEQPGEQGGGAEPENGQDPKKSKRRRRRESGPGASPGQGPSTSERQQQEQPPERGPEPFDQQQQGSASGIPPPPRARASSSPEDAPAGDYRDRRGGYRSPDGPASRSRHRLPSRPGSRPRPGYRSRSRDYQAGSDLPPPPPPVPHRGGGKPSWGGSRSRSRSRSRERPQSERGGGAWSRGGKGGKRGRSGGPRDRSREGRPYHQRSRSRSRDWDRDQDNNMCRPKTGARAPVLRPKSAAKPY